MNAGARFLRIPLKFDTCAPFFRLPVALVWQLKPFCRRIDISRQTPYPAAMVADILFAGIGGFAGSALRCAAGFVPVKNPAGFPIKTFLINVAGCFVFALAGCMAAKRGSLNPRALVMVRTGFCGGFTTFSAFAAESAALLKGGNFAAAAAYIAASVAAGLLAVFAAEKAFGE